MGELATKAVTSALDIVLSRAYKELTLAFGLKDDLQKMVERLQMINSILITSGVEICPIATRDHSQVSDPIQLWMGKVQRIVNEVENILDLIAYEKIRREQLGSNIPFKRRIRLFFSLSNSIIFRQLMAHRISSMNKTLKEVERGQKVVTTVANLQAYSKACATNASGGSATTTRRSSDDDLQQIRKYVEVSNVVGRHKDEEKLVKMLCSSSFPDHNQQISAVALVGLGGIGKTVLANKVLENEIVKNHFKYRIWVVVPEDFNITKILIDMLAYIDDNKGGGSVVKKLRERINGERFLLVLDNVWNTKKDLWNAMKSSLESIQGSNESMILVTTRDNGVAHTMGASIFPLSELTEDNSWYLFKQVAFSNTFHDDISTLESIGKNIVCKCKGIPLAIITIGGILSSKTNSSEWMDIERSELWNLPQDEVRILPSLKLSFDHLPHPSLKKCFTFCALWPKGIPFEKYQVKYRWMALGYIQNNDKFSSHVDKESIAEQYFDYLLSISFLMVHSWNEDGEASHYILHDLVYDLARSLNMHERFILEAGEEVNNVDHIQHLTVMNQDVDITPNFPSVFPLKNLHSLDIFMNRQAGLLLRHVKYLRILSLFNTGLEVLPESIARLKCLKFLDLGGNPITIIPEWITELYNLQSLYLFGCKYLSDLPRTLGKLINLQHLILSFDYCPAEGVIQQLSHLQILPSLHLSDGGFKINELESLHHIRGKLEIKGLQLIENKQDAEMAHLSSKSRVDQVCLIWDNDDNRTNHEEVLNALYPNPHLKKLMIKGYAGDNFPLWLLRMNASQESKNGAFCNLQNIQLVDCGNCRQLPTLGNLPCLKLLEITKMDSLTHINPEFYCGTDEPLECFPRLKELRVCQIANLVEWCYPASLKNSIIFPSLEVLAIEDCPMLIATPNKFPSLKVLKIKKCELLVCLPSLNNLNNLSIIGMTLLINEPPVWLYTLPCLKVLHIGGFTELNDFPDISSLMKIASPETLYVYGWAQLQNIPEQLQEFSTLQNLFISNFENLEELPDLIQSLSSLKMLGLTCCKKLKKLASAEAMKLLRNSELRSLEIKDCPLLEENIKPNGSEYHKITRLDVKIFTDFTP